MITMSKKGKPATNNIPAVAFKNKLLSSIRESESSAALGPPLSH